MLLEALGSKGLIQPVQVESPALLAMDESPEIRAQRILMVEFLQGERAHFQSIERLRDVIYQLCSTPTYRHAIPLDIFGNVGRLADIQLRFLLAAEMNGQKAPDQQKWLGIFSDWSSHYG